MSRTKNIILICGWTIPLMHERRPRWVFTPKQVCHVQERHVVKLCAPEPVLRVMRLFTVSSNFYFKAIQTIKTYIYRGKQKDGKDTRQTCPVTHKDLPYALRTITSLGPAEVAWETDSLPYFFWSLWTII